MLTKNDAVKLEVPPAFRDMYVVRCVEKKSGPNSKGNPMVTSQWEVVGRPDGKGSVETEITRNGQKYQIAGLRTQPSWNVLVPGLALNSYIELWEKAHPGQEFQGVNPENPDIEWLDGLLMLAILTTTENVQRKELTDEEKADRKAKNLPLLGEPIKDGDGKEVKSSQVKISEFRELYTGDAPERPF